MLRKIIYPWKQIPLLRALLMFMIGIIIGVFYPAFEISVLSIGSALVLIFLSHLRRDFIGFSKWLLLFLSLGYAITTLQTERLFSDHIHHNYSEKEQQLVINIISDPIEKENSLKVEAELVSSAAEELTVVSEIHGKVLLYFEKDSLTKALKYGDKVVCLTRLNATLPPSNPDEFNYQRYLGFHQITEQGYVRSGKWKLIETGSGLNRTMIEIQHFVIQVLEEHGIKDRHLAIVSALLVGYKHMLTADQVSAFASAGAMHVLAVSGLHVGIVFLILNSLFKPLIRFRNGHWIKAIIMLLVLWMYAMITGLSPSVTRAVTMFSFIVVSQLINRRTSIYNTLATSAFLLLLYNPFLIVEVGFQLSYIAVLGIVMLQPRIYAWWQPTYWILDKIWAITSVSLAAQIATFPLGLLYFHQFPNYFLLSNLVVIPLATIILSLGIALVAFSFIPLLSTIIGKVLQYLLWFLDSFILFVERLPMALIQGIDIGIIETYLIYMIVGLFIAIIIYKTYKLQLTFMFFLLLLFVINLNESIEQLSQKQIVFYKVNGSDAIDFISGQTHVFLADSALLNNEDKLRFHVYHHWWKLDLTQPKDSISGLIQKQGMVNFYDKMLCMLDRNTIIQNQTNGVDVLIITQRTEQHPCEILEYLKPNLVVLSANLDWKTNSYWDYILKLEGIEAHSIKNDGALVLNINEELSS